MVIGGLGRLMRTRRVGAPRFRGIRHRRVGRNHSPELRMQNAPHGLHDRTGRQDNVNPALASWQEAIVRSNNATTRRRCQSDRRHRSPDERSAPRWPNHLTGEYSELRRTTAATAEERILRRDFPALNQFVNSSEPLLPAPGNVEQEAA